MSLYSVESSRNIFIKLSKYFINVLVTTFWYVGGPLLIPNGITFHIKAPQSVTNAILYLSFGAIKIWWYLEYLSHKEYASYPTIVFNISFVKGNGYGYFFVITFSFLKSIQILNLPFFVGITTMGDNHVASSTDWMNPIANNLSIFCLTPIT